MATLDERRPVRTVTARARPQVVPWLRAHLGTRLTVGAPGHDGRAAVGRRFPESHDPARELCPDGEGLEVLGPPEVRARLAEIGAALVARYGETAGAGAGAAGA